MDTYNKYALAPSSCNGLTAHTNPHNITASLNIKNFKDFYLPIISAPKTPITSNTIIAAELLQPTSYLDLSDIVETNHNTWMTVDLLNLFIFDWTISDYYVGGIFLCKLTFLSFHFY